MGGVPHPGHVLVLELHLLCQPPQDISLRQLHTQRSRRRNMWGYGCQFDQDSQGGSHTCSSSWSSPIATRSVPVLWASCAQSWFVRCYALGPSASTRPHHDDIDECRHHAQERRGRAADARCCCSGFGLASRSRRSGPCLARHGHRTRSRRARRSVGTTSAPTAAPKPPPRRSERTLLHLHTASTKDD